MKKSKARKGEEDKRELCQRISKLHSYLREMKTKYAPKSVEDSDWSPLFKLAVDDFETVDYYYELFILESTEEEQKKIYEELKKEIETIERRHFNYRIAEGEQRVAEKIIGKGGEGKSRIGLVLRELFGNNMYSCSLQKIEVDKFARANLEYMLITVDDDMKLEALPQTNHIKSIVTLEDQIDLERKGQQSFQGVVYARLIAFGNGGLHALYDKTDGFYRRQLILTTKDKVDGREDDPYLIDKLRKERDGIFLWALEGLQRLVSNNYVFTESVDAKQNLVDAQEEGNNILAFMKSEGYLQFEIGKKISSTDFYNIYVSWCEDNLEKPRASAGFLHYIKENQKRYGLIYDAKCIGNRRGFHNVCKAEFTPVAGKTPFD